MVGVLRANYKVLSIFSEVENIQVYLLSKSGA